MKDFPKTGTEPEKAPHDLTAQARAGSKSAFERLYRAHVGKVYAVCLRILGDPSSAEDVTQKVFIRSWEKLPSFRGESSFGSWIYRLAVNAAINELKALKLMKNRDDLLKNLQSEPAGEVSNTQDAQIDLERAVAALPQGARIVFVLHEIMGFNHEDIAVSLGLSKGTSKAQLARARKLLREALEKE